MKLIAFLIATAFGAGLSPFFPGSFGSLVGMGIAYWSADWAIHNRVIFWLATLLIGTWAAKVFDQDNSTRDNKQIVIDEVIGMGIASWTSPTTWGTTWVVAFFIFRFFDIVKPFPIRKIDQWSKNQTSDWIGGFAVIADDIVAGLFAFFIIFALQFCGFLK